MSIAVWNLFAKANKDVSTRVVDKFTGALNSDNLAALVREWQGALDSITTTAHVNGSVAAERAGRGKGR